MRHDEKWTGDGMVKDGMGGSLPVVEEYFSGEKVGYKGVDESAENSGVRQLAQLLATTRHETKSQKSLKRQSLLKSVICCLFVAKSDQTSFVLFLASKPSQSPSILFAVYHSSGIITASTTMVTMLIV